MLRMYDPLSRVHSYDNCVEDAVFLLATAQVQQRHSEDIKSHMTQFLETAVIEHIGLHMSQSIGYFESTGEELKFL
jgi:hypothetical protein